MSIPYQGVGAPLTKSDVQQVVQSLGCEEAALWALLTVETSGFGFLPDRRPKILFERHIFYRLTKGTYSNNSDISSSTAGGYVGGGAEYDRLAAAAKLNLEAAMESASWGVGQIMGYHAKRLGYSGVAAMVQEFQQSEHAQLQGFAKFIATEPALSKAFTSGDWRKVAFYYNGAEYAKKEYDFKLKHYYEKYSQEGCPSVDLREAQALLAYLGFDPHGIDGFWGKNSKAALRQFLATKGQAANDIPDDQALALLRYEGGVQP